MKLQAWITTGVMAALLLGVSFGTAHAQATPPNQPQTQPLLPEPAPPMSATEFATPPMSDSFADLDRDNDGVITPGEAVRSRQVATSFERLDENGDGRLDLAEFAQLNTPLPTD